MCTAIPAQVIAITKTANNTPLEGVVSLLGPNGPTTITRKVSLLLTPQAHEDSFVLLHVEHAISMIDEKEAIELAHLLNELTEIDE